MIQVSVNWAFFNDPGNYVVAVAGAWALLYMAYISVRVFLLDTTK